MPSRARGDRLLDQPAVLLEHPRPGDDHRGEELGHVVRGAEDRLPALLLELLGEDRLEDRGRVDVARLERRQPLGEAAHGARLDVVDADPGALERQREQALRDGPGARVADLLALQVLDRLELRVRARDPEDVLAAGHAAADDPDVRAGLERGDGGGRRDLADRQPAADDVADRGPAALGADDLLDAHAVLVEQPLVDRGDPRRREQQRRVVRDGHVAALTALGEPRVAAPGERHDERERRGRPLHAAAAADCHVRVIPRARHEKRRPRNRPSGIGPSVRRGVGSGDRRTRTGPRVLRRAGVVGRPPLAVARGRRRRALGADDLELLATSAYMLGRDDEYVRALERAHHAHLDAGEPLRAVRCAFWLGLSLAAARRDGPRDRLVRPRAAAARARRGATASSTAIC